jgi:hypothetical protein
MATSKVTMELKHSLNLSLTATLPPRFYRLVSMGNILPQCMEADNNHTTPQLEGR